ncbi:hypothetical protein [Reyranella sp.]|uniref:hypothetical protein n=1 Tax=Reyranella sp. TaxID=1929291 RepID=UPI0027312D47|nr:hypothetical protein [Reyranella sp.]MDP2376546.1 hypothetical protein [Reyranella sp.]
MVETITERVLFCPDDLYRDAGAEPRPAAAAIVQHNAAGGDFIDAVIDWAQQQAGVITDARAACEIRGAAAQ